MPVPKFHDNLKSVRSDVEKFLQSERDKPGSIHPVSLAALNAILNAMDRLEDAEHSIGVLEHNDREAEAFAKKSDSKATTTTTSKSSTSAKK